MIIRSTNGGDSWESQYTGLAGYTVEDLFFLNSRLGWFVANDGGYTATRIGKTTNGGVNWVITPFPDSASINWCISFTDSLTGFLSGYSGKIYKTIDGGLSWGAAFIDPAGCPPLFNFPKNRIRFFNSVTGFACGGVYDIQGIIWKTTDAGNNWQTYCVAPEPFFDIKPTPSSSPPPPPAIAAQETSAQWLRPLLMTALVALFGLLPAALSRGIGSETQKPLAVVVIGGALALALLTRLVQPALLVLFDRGIER